VIEWRPQRFGRKRFRDVADPVIEPVWVGERVLVHVDGGSVSIVDGDGDRVPDSAELEAAVAAAALAEQFVLDAYLTRQATRSTVGAFIGDVAIPSAGQMATQFVFGSGRSRRAELGADARAAATVLSGDTPLAVVATDLLAIDRQPLLEVPLLERKRLLESALRESELVRFSAYVRPPVDPWIGSWRSLGFTTMAYKAANSRYRPGADNDAWALVPIPQR
jgi:ATP-dependent DNA ligase